MSRILKLDVDGQRLLSLGVLCARLRDAGYRLRALAQWVSPSERGFHVQVLVTPLPSSACEIVALQLLCGSDPRREAHNLERARAIDLGHVSQFWRDRANVLYGKSS